MIVSLIMSIDFRFREFFYPIDLIRLRRRFERSQWFSPEEQARDQEGRLRRIIEQAYYRVPYYHDLFRRLKLLPEDIRTADDLRKLPTLSKATLRGEFPRLQATDSRRYHPRPAQTSGSSGEPLRFLLDKQSRVLEFVYYWRHWSWAGYRLGHRFAELGSHYFLRDESRAGQVCRYQPSTGRLLLNGLEIGPERVREYARAMHTYRPMFLKAMASALYYFAFFLREAGIRGFGLRGAFSTGELLMPHQRRLIEEVFGCRVLDSYGHMERTVAISECPEGGLHINPDYGVLELVQRPRVATAPEEGRVTTAEVVGTSLHNFSMPLLRYEVGDLVELDEDPHRCPCGRAMPRVRRINGRREDAIITPGGRVVTTLFIVFDKVPGIAQGQVIQEDVDELRIRIVRNPDYTERSEDLLLGLLRCFVGPRMKLRLEYSSRDALHRAGSEKFRTILSRIPQMPGPATIEPARLRKGA
jgi:phenylacetate-CoA ligase